MKDDKGVKVQVTSFIDPVKISTMKKEFLTKKENLKSEEIEKLLNATMIKTSSTQHTAHPQIKTYSKNAPPSPPQGGRGEGRTQ